MNTLCKLFLMCVLFLFGIKAHGQTTNELNRMINESLLAYIHKWQVYVDQGIASPTVLENVCLQTDHYPPYFKFDQRILDMNPEQCSMANLQYNKAWRKKQKKGIGRKYDIFPANFFCLIAMSV